MFLKSSIVFFGILLFLIIEFIFPKEKNLVKNKLKRLFKNIFFWLINVGLTPILILPISIYATQIEIHSFFKFDN